MNGPEVFRTSTLYINTSTCPSCHLIYSINGKYEQQVLMNNTWTPLHLDRGLGAVFSKSERVGILKNGSNIICTSLKNKHFLFYAQGCGTKIKPAIPFRNYKFKWS